MRAIRRIGISGGAAVLVALGAAAPAYAVPPGDPVVQSPTGTVEAANADVVATWQMNDGEPTSAARLRLERPGGSVASSSATAGGTMRFPVTLDLNGTYTAQVSIDWRERRLLGDRSGTATSAKRSFKVAVPPATPVGVTTSVDAASRNVTVAWEKNPEPDMRRYEVRRSHNGGDFAPVGTVDHPEAKFVDATTAGAGGEYRYIVVAYRAGVDAAVASQLASDPSATTKASTAAVPDPPPPPTTAPPATAPPASAAPGAPAPAPSAAPGTTAPASAGGIATSGKVDLSGFDNVQANTPRPVTPRTVPLPDPGFQSTLPFDLPEGEAAEEPEAGDTGELAAPDVRELGDEADSGDRQRSLALFAGGLLATVLLMHVMWVRGEVKRVPLEALVPEGPPPGEGGGDRTRRARAAKAKPGRAGRVASPDWFVPDLGVDDGAGRAVAAGMERKAS